jgi:non-ribosomal peptide synthetase component F
MVALDHLGYQMSGCGVAVADDNSGPAAAERFLTRVPITSVELAFGWRRNRLHCTADGLRWWELISTLLVADNKRPLQNDF